MNVLKNLILFFKFLLLKKVSVPKVRKKISECINLINSDYNLNDINTKLLDTIKRYELSFSGLRISYSINLYQSDINKCIVSMDYIGVNYYRYSHMHYVGDLQGIHMNIDLYDTLSTWHTIYVYQNIHRHPTWPQSGSGFDVMEVENYYIDYIDYSVNIYYNDGSRLSGIDDSEEDIILEAFSLLEKYGFNIVTKKKIDMYGYIDGYIAGCNSMILYNKRIYV